MTEVASSPTPRTLEVSVSGDSMQIDQTNVTINIDGTNPFKILEPPKSYKEDIEDKLKLIEEEKMKLEEERKKEEEEKKRIMEEEIRRKVEKEKRKWLEEEEKKEKEEREKGERRIQEEVEKK